MSLVAVDRYYNRMYRCMYDLVMPRCGSKAALLHINYSIKLWEPAVTAFYCDVGRSALTDSTIPNLFIPMYIRGRPKLFFVFIFGAKNRIFGYIR